jgi:hypothetical protein
MIDLDEANDENDNFFTLDLDQEDEEADLAGRRRFVRSFSMLPADVEQGGRRSWGLIGEPSHSSVAPDWEASGRLAVEGTHGQRTGQSRVRL